MIVSQLNGQSISWQEDYNNRMNPTLMTTLLHKAIPVLKSVDWRVREVTDGGCITELPLCYESTNQHGTHQAALISLSADYTGGIALASLLRGIPFAGVHPCNEENSASLWLAAMDVRYRNPSTEHLFAKCTVPEDVCKTVRHRYYAGKRVLVTLPVTFVTAADETVAEAHMKYFVQPSIQLKPTKSNPKITPLFRHKLKASARMIAGIRAGSNGGTESVADSGSDGDYVRIDRAHERHAAGPHGEILARRLSDILPQLQDVVVARTRHIDEVIRNIQGLRQVVILGVGLDMRPFRLTDSLDRPTFFEMDLPEMLEERSRVIAQMKDRPVVQRRMIATDFKQDHVGELLLKHPDFDPRLPTFVVYEGCSMYFDREENVGILRDSASILEHPDSRLWCDMVTTSVANGTTNNREILEFLAGMDELGESFVFGSDDPAEFMRECGFSQARVTIAKDYLASPDPSFSTYQFIVAKL